MGNRSRWRSATAVLVFRRRSAVRGRARNSALPIRRALNRGPTTTPLTAMGGIPTRRTTEADATTALGLVGCVYTQFFLVSDTLANDSL